MRNIDRGLDKRVEARRSKDSENKTSKVDRVIKKN